MLRLSLTAYIRISAPNHLFCIYEIQKRLFDKRGRYEINIGKLKTIIYMIKGRILLSVYEKKTIASKKGTHKERHLKRDNYRGTPPEGSIPMEIRK